MMPMNYNPYPYPNTTPGFNFIDYQNMINGNINIYNNFNNKAMMYPNMPSIPNMPPGMMNKMMYPSNQMTTFPTSSSPYTMSHPPYFERMQNRPLEKSNPNPMYNEEKDDDDDEDEDLFDNDHY